MAKRISLLFTAMLTACAAVVSAQAPSDNELELERDMEYFVEPEEALGPRTRDPLAD